MLVILDRYYVSKLYSIINIYIPRLDFVEKAAVNIFRQLLFIDKK